MSPHPFTAKINPHDLKRLPTAATDLTVVMYHYVRDIAFSRYPGIRGLETSDFIKQISFLSAEYNIISMKQVINYYMNGDSLPPKALLLTFDDGYAEHFSNVYPILKSFGVTGAFYVSAKVILEHRVLDVNKIHFVLASCSDLTQIVDIMANEMTENRLEYSLKPFEYYQQKYTVEFRFDSKEIIFIKRMLQHVLPEVLRSSIIDKLFKHFVDVPEAVLSRELYLKEYQLKEMLAGGMHLGCHGYDHYWWNKLSPEALNKEVDLSLEFLSSLGISQSEWTACYPYGSSNSDVVKLLSQKGCCLALTTVAAKADLSSDHPLLIPRLDTNEFPPTSQRY